MREDPGLNKGGIMSLVIVFLLLAVVIVTQRQKVNYLDKHPVYTKGIVAGKIQKARGEHYILYTFSVDTTSYIGRVPVKFCLECRDSYCVIGEKVRVKYADGDPSNNELVH